MTAQCTFPARRRCLPARWEPTPTWWVVAPQPRFREMLDAGRFRGFRPVRVFRAEQLRGATLTPRDRLTVEGLSHVRARDLEDLRFQIAVVQARRWRLCEGPVR